MPSVTSVEDKLAELSTITGLSAAEWEDFMSCTPSQQELIAQGYADMDWVQTPDLFAKVITVLQTIGLIAGVVGGVAGAASAVAALRKL